MKRLVRNSYIFLTLSIIMFTFVSDAIAQHHRDQRYSQIRPGTESQGQAAQPVLSGVYTIQQESTRQYLDAHDTPDKDFAVVTRPCQDNTTQRWMFSRVNNNVYTIQQRSTGRFLDAHATLDKDFAVVTRSRQANSTQLWIVTALGNDMYSIQQQGTGRYLDAHAIVDKDFAVVTRPPQGNATQRWIIKQGLRCGNR